MTSTLVRPMTTEWFSISNFKIDARLAERSHTFQYNNKEIRITLPAIPPSESGMAWFNENIFVASRRKQDDQLISISCYVERVKVCVISNQELSIPEDHEGEDYAAEPTVQHKALESILEEHNALAEHAFSYWVDVIRWKTLDGQIGRPVATTEERPTRVFDSYTGRGLYRGPTQLIARLDRDPGMTTDEWDSAQEALAAGLPIPIWFAFLFQGEHRLSFDDRTEAILNTAIACEVLTRTLYWQDIPNASQVSEGAREIIDKATVRSITDSWGRMDFWRSSYSSIDQWKKSFVMQDLHKLFDLRNKIAHLADNPPKREKCAKLTSNARKFVISADRLVKPVEAAPPS